MKHHYALKVVYIKYMEFTAFIQILKNKVNKNKLDIR